MKTAPTLNRTNASSSSRTTVPTVLTHRASDGVTSATIPADAANSAGVVAETLRSLDPEYEDVLASRLAGKDAKFDFKAQVAAAKAFYPKAKTLLKTFRGVIVDIAGAVEDARRENANAILEAVVAAEDRPRPRRDFGFARRRAQALDAAGVGNGEAREAFETKLQAALERSRVLEQNAATATETVETLTKKLAESETRAASLGASLEASVERVNDLTASAAPAKAQIDALLADKASTHETLGSMKGELMSANVQLESMRSAAKEHESEKARETEKTNLLYADLARVSAEKEGANEQLAAAREEAASARAASAEASVLVAETKARALRLEDAAEHAASDLARAKSERDGVEKRPDETAAELTRVSTSLAAAEARAEAAERDAATNAANAKEASRLRDELEARSEKRRLEPRVETLNAEQQARADAKVARAESGTCAPRVTRRATAARARTPSALS